jgi:hypothetical protein
MNLSPRSHGLSTGNVRPSSDRRNADQYIAGLEAKLAIRDSQKAAWELFAERLRANRRRLQAHDHTTDQPFGTLEDRLAARESMQRAAAHLFAALDTVQQQTAVQLLPLCCLPCAITTRAANGSRARKQEVEKAELIKELKRNAVYYSAGPDREAGALLWRAANALAL